MKTTTEMHYNRTMSPVIEDLLETEYKWLIDFVKSRDDLDFQIGSNLQSSWLSVYRGTSRIFRIIERNKKIVIDADSAYKELEPQLYESPSEALFESLIEKIKNYKSSKTGKNYGKNTLSRYYDNKREGYYQNNISRRYGILGRNDDDFIIVDKESVIGFYEDVVKKRVLKGFAEPYMKIGANIMASEIGFPSKLDEMILGNECDFMVLTKDGELILMELKDGGDTQKIYLSPFQISMYCDIFIEYDRISNDFRDTILEMVKQKQRLGLLNPQWKVPSQITKISAALVVGGDFSKVAAEKYNIVRKYVSKYDIATYITKGESGEINLKVL